MIPKNFERINFVLVIITVALVSLYFNTTYVKALVDKNLISEISFTGDSSGYINLARNIAYHHRYSISSSESKHVSVLRTPGYPLFYSLFEYFGLAPVGVLIAQVFIGMCISLIIVSLTYLITGKLILSFFAGLLGAQAPIGILLTGDIMVDLLFSFVFIVGYFSLMIGICQQRQIFIIFSGLFFGLGTIVKPTLFFWPLYSILIFYIISRAYRTKIQIIRVTLFLIIQMFFVAGWSARNYVAENIFTLSTIGVQTLDQYLSTQVYAYRSPDRELISLPYIIKKRQIYLRKKLAKDLENGVTIKEISNNQRKRSLKIILSDPILSLYCFIENIKLNTSGKLLWTFDGKKIVNEYYNALPKNSTLKFLFPKMVKYNQKFLMFCYIFIPLFLIISIIINKKLDNDYLYRQCYLVFSLSLTFLYFAFLSGFTSLTGPRIVFPANFTLIVIIAVIIDYCITLFRLKMSEFAAIRGSCPIFQRRG
jgi:4-amino-4-deoxy-L-arabinose transferase-like glycosyltransferase